MQNLIQNDLTTLLKQTIREAVAQELEGVNDKNNSIVFEFGNVKFYNIKEVSKLTGLSTRQTRKVFNDPEFPCCMLGKTYVVEESALRAYFSVRRDRNDSPYWRAFN